MRYPRLVNFSSLLQLSKISSLEDKKPIHDANIIKDYQNLENESSVVLCDCAILKNLKRKKKKKKVVVTISSIEVACGPMKHQHTVGLMTANKMLNQP